MFACLRTHDMISAWIHSDMCVQLCAWLRVFACSELWAFFRVCLFVPVCVFAHLCVLYSLQGGKHVRKGRPSPTPVPVMSLYDSTTITYDNYWGGGVNNKAYTSRTTPLHIWSNKGVHMASPTVFFFSKWFFFEMFSLTNRVFKCTYYGQLNIDRFQIATSV